MIRHNRPTLGLQEQEAATRALERGWVAEGVEVEALETELCQFFDLPDGHAVAVSSGSAALYLALWALGGNNKRIGLPVYSCSALRNAVGLIGGECNYLDCEEGSPNVDVSAAIRARVDILIAPSMFGIPIDLPDSSDLTMIEDIAQSIGAMVSGKRIGLRGEVGVCSFYATKLLTSGGQGGAVISRNRTLVERVRDYREFDCRDDALLRFNFQMTDLQAAVGRVQLKRLPEFLARREKWFQMYKSAGLDLLDRSGPGVQPVRYRIVMRCAKPASVIAALALANIGAIVPIEERELLDEPRLYPAALALAKATVSLPCYPALREEDVIQIARAVSETA